MTAADSPLFTTRALPMTCAGEELLLHPERALYWPARRMLLAADIHLGKEHTFGRSSIAIPGGVSEDTLTRLFTLCDDAGAQTLMVLGDFMHSAPLSSETWLCTLCQLLEQRPGLEMHIVAGNHDKRRGQLLTDKRVQWHQQAIVQGPFVLQHEPSDDPRGYVLAGHLHPAWRLGRGRRGGVRAPIFWFRHRHAVLPAFGVFTGGVCIQADQPSDQIYMTCDDGVLQVPADSRRPRRRRRLNSH